MGRRDSAKGDFPRSMAPKRIYEGELKVEGAGVTLIRGKNPCKRTHREKEMK